MLIKVHILVWRDQFGVLWPCNKEGLRTAWGGCGRDDIENTHMVVADRSPAGGLPPGSPSFGGNWSWYVIEVEI